MFFLKHLDIKSSGIRYSYYQISKERKLFGKDIKKLFFDHTVTGFGFWTDKQWWVSSTEEDSAVYRSTDITENVEIWFENDMICKQGKKLYGGLRDCAYVYSNPRGKPENKDEYFLMTDYSPFAHFKRPPRFLPV